MKTGKEYLESLHPVEQANWEESLKNDSNYHSMKRGYLMRRFFTNLRDFLEYSFVWSETPQGYEYWDLLSQK
jgi:hypothetical protein